MCGIVGFFDPSSPSEERQSAIRTMTRQLAHRGPDHEATWLESDFPLAFGHRRLAILDLSPSGEQPMTSRSGKSTLILNGEIYNFQELRKELEERGVRFRGTSDTEVLVEGFEVWGFEDTLRRSVGMFSLALWNRETRTLSLARDRLGEKPLYAGWNEGRFLFGSELKALRAHPRFQARLDSEARTAYFALGYVPTPLSIYEGISKLNPGSTLHLEFGAPGNSARPKERRTTYWDPLEVLKSSRPFEGSFEEATEETEALLKRAIGLQQVADVPVGAFLSGGIDSSTVVSLFQEVSSRPIKTFTIGFEDKRFDESKYAAQMARHLGTEHQEWILSDKDALQVVPELGWMYDEPFSDSSQIPTYLVSRFARSQVTVSISGDAGDELFGGYNRYFWGNRIWNRVGAWPRPLRAGVGKILGDFSGGFGRAFEAMRPILPRSLHVHQPEDKFRKLGNILASENQTAFYRQLLITQEPGDILQHAELKNLLRYGDSELLDHRSLSERMMFLDLTNYLTDDILVKVDRAAMASSLETRVPLLDHRIVEWAWRLPESYRIRGTTGKPILRSILGKRIPTEWMDRPKTGFGIPLGSWLRSQLKDWAQDLISDSRLKDEEDLHVPEIRTLWNEHQSGQADHGYRLWNILMYFQWKSSQSRRTQ